MKYKLIATDFDGTLLNDDKKITEKTKETLLKCKEKGYFITGVTARNLESTRQVLPLDIFDYIILNNGTYIYDVKNNSCDYIGIINKSLISSIINETEQDSSQIDIITPFVYYTYKNKKNSDLYFIKDIDSIDEINEDISRMNIFLLDQTKIEYYKNLINEKYNDVNCFIMQDSSSIYKWLVVNPKNLNKSTTLKILGKKLNINLQEMIFFGDSSNDLEVIEAVGYGVAMGNALDIIKEKADEVTLSNNEDGVAVFIEKIMNNNQ